jgi:hypothetical protein
MTARPAFGALVSEQGTCIWDDLHGFQSYLRGLAGKRVRVVVSRETKGRTLPQNSWLWGAIYPAIADWSGHTVDEIHAVMKDMHGLKTLVTMAPAGEGRFPGQRQTLVPRSTATYTTEEFSTYVERVRAWAAMQGLNIPDPGRVG